MDMVVHSFERPQRFIVGTVGPPGQRTFFLQAKEGSRVTSVALEKQQVSVLAERIDSLLDQILRRGGESIVPAVAPRVLADNEPLDQPIVEEFRVGTMTLAWDPDDDRVVIELFALSEENVVTDEEASAGSSDPDDPEPDTGEIEAGEIEAGEVVIVKLEPGYARAFAQRAQRVVSAGRPACPFCGGPLDPDGHICPRSNGFHRIATS
jgi:uncharacterized repeat protein (TIGR03847 family)